MYVFKIKWWRDAVYRNRKAIISVAIFIALWECVSRSGIINPLLFPPPSEVLLALKDWFENGNLLNDILVSCSRMLAGFLLGGLSGVVIGMLTGRIGGVKETLSPIIQMFRPLPPVAIIPLVIVWLGIGDGAKIFSISFGVFFPVWVNTHAAASTIPINYIRSAQILTKSRSRLWLSVLIPACLPAIVTGLRVSIALAFVMVYVSEIAGASEGLGYYISISQLSYRINHMVAGLVVLAGLGALVDYVFTAVLEALFPWIKMIAR